MELHQVPELKESEEPGFSCRPGTAADLPAMQRLYDEAVQDLGISACRDDGIWKYLWEHAPSTDTGCEGWVVEDSDKNVIGYFRMEERPWWPSISVNEASLLNYNTALAVLQQLKKLAIDREKPYIRLALPRDCVLMETARYHGAHELETYAWQIHIPDMGRLLRAIGPVLERRLEESPFSGLTEEVKLNFYREAVALNFVDGKIEKVQKLDSSDGSIRVPPRAAVPLLLGYRNREELQDSWPDMGMPPKEAYLMDILFPKMTSHIYTIY